MAYPGLGTVIRCQVEALVDQPICASTKSAKYCMCRSDLKQRVALYAVPVDWMQNKLLVYRKQTMCLC